MRASLLCERTAHLERNSARASSMHGAGSGGQLRRFGRRRRSRTITRSLRDTDRSLRGRDAAAARDAVGAAAGAAGSVRPPRRAVALVCAYRTAGLAVSPASLELVLRAMAARPESRPAAWRQVRQLVSLVPELPCQQNSPPLSSRCLRRKATTLRRWRYLVCSHLPPFLPHQVECNLTAWALEAAALDDDARTRLAVQVVRLAGGRRCHWSGCWPPEWT